MVKVEKFGTMNELECVIKFNQTYRREPTVSLFAHIEFARWELI